MIDIPFLDARAGGTEPGTLPEPITGDTEKTYAIPANDGLALVMVRNEMSEAHPVVVTPTATIAGMTASAVTFDCPPGDTWLPVFPPAIYNDDRGDCVLVDTDDALSFTGLRI